ncbi:hypothetical protein EMIT0196MI5_60235 [Pseudomonas sp. IT-196MI5]
MKCRESGRLTGVGRQLAGDRPLAIYGCLSGADRSVFIGFRESGIPLGRVIQTIRRISTATPSSGGQELFSSTRPVIFRIGAMAGAGPRHVVVWLWSNR